MAALALSGQLKARPGRYKNRLQEPKPRAGIGNSPAHLTPEQKVIWREIVQTVPAGVLALSDRILVEVAVRAVERLRSGQIHRAAEITTLLRVLGKLGMSPIDRARLSIQPEPEAPVNDPWESLLK